MAILLKNGRTQTRSYEDIGFNLHLLKEKTELHNNWLQHIIKNVQSEYVQLRLDYVAGFIEYDTYFSYLKKIGEFIEMVNKPISMNISPEILEELKSQDF
jgi:hypothetical protein